MDIPGEASAPNSIPGSSANAEAGPGPSSQARALELARRTASPVGAVNGTTSAAGQHMTPGEKEAKLKDKELALARVVDRHDDLIRELFHMERFVTIITGFDPKLVKQDKSPVFLNYLAERDLVTRFATTSCGAAPRGRTTRRAFADRKGALALAPAPEAVPVSAAAGSSTAAGSSKANGHAASVETSEMDGAVEVLPSANAPVASKRKQAGKAKAAAQDTLPAVKLENTPKSNRSHKRQTPKDAPAPSRRSDRAKVALSEEPPSAAGSGSPEPTALVNGKKRASARARDAPSKRRKTSLTSITGPPPPPRYTHPEQLPPPVTPFGHDISALLTAYRMLDDKEVDDATLQKEAQAAASVMVRVRYYQQFGRMLDVNSPDESRAAAAIAANRPVVEAKRVPDHQSNLLMHVAQVRTAMLAEHKGHIVLARKLARAVQAHFEHAQGKEARAAKDEERRKKTAMRELTRAVKAKWKLAVNVIRARKVAEAKAEQDRMGKAHLQSILDRSTGLIEAHRDHITGRRRSSASASASVEPSGGEGTPASSRADGVESDGGDDMGRAMDVLEDDSDGHTAEESAASDSEDDGGEEEEEGVEDLRQLFSDAEDAASEVQTPAAERSDGEGDDAIRVVNGDQEDREVHETSAEHKLEIATSMEVDVASPIAEPAQNIVRAEVPVAKSAVHSIKDDAPEVQVKEEDPDDAGSDFEQVDDDAYQDQGLDIAMEAAEGSVRADSEDEGLKADADLPIEALLARYGYGADDVAALKSSKAVDPKVEAEEAGADAAVDEVETTTIGEDGIRRSNRKRKPRTIRDSYSPLARPEEPQDVSMEQDDEVGEEVDDFEPTPDDSPVRPPFLLRGTLRPYQQAGLEWLAGLYRNKVNGILADEMGLGKTIQTIALLGHLACDKGQWGPHLIVVPTSVILNWEMEFKKFLPGMRVLTYYGNQKERKERRVGWATDNFFQVCITSYQLVLADQHIFRRKNWQYLILDEAHNIKNFRSQRWQTLLGFRSERRLLLTGTPLQNNLMELWSLMYFLMPNGASAELSEASGFANHREFSEWFSNPMEKAVEHGTTMTEETRETIERLHTILRPYMLRRLKSEVETQLPAKHEHVTYCKLSKRQRFLYDEFMSRASTRESLISGGYLGVANCLMQLRKVCNHPDLFEVRPVRTSFAMGKSVASGCERGLARFRGIAKPATDNLNLEVLNLRLLDQEQDSAVAAAATRRLDASRRLPAAAEQVEDVPCDTRTLAGWQKFRSRQIDVARGQRWTQTRYLNRLRCQRRPLYGADVRRAVACSVGPQWQLPAMAEIQDMRQKYTLEAGAAMTLSWKDRLDTLSPILDRFAVITPAATTSDTASLAVPGVNPEQHPELLDLDFDLLHKPAVKLQIAFPDASLLQYDCGKLQTLHDMLKDLKAGGHRVIIFTQMTKMLDVLELFLSYNGHRYFRLDGGTKIEERQRITERFNTDTRIFAFIASTRAGGVGINLTGADTVIFYDADYNVAMDRQAMDRAHRIGQTREVNIYRLVTSHTVEENILRKSNQKRLLDNLVIQEGNFTTDFFGKLNLRDMLGEDILQGLETSDSPLGRAGSEVDDRRQMESALAQAEDEEDAAAARMAEGEVEIDDVEFEAADRERSRSRAASGSATPAPSNEAATPAPVESLGDAGTPADEGDAFDDEPGSVDEYMLRMVDWDWAYFS